MHFMKNHRGGSGGTGGGEVPQTKQQQRQQQQQEAMLAAAAALAPLNLNIPRTQLHQQQTHGSSLQFLDVLEYIERYPVYPPDYLSLPQSRPRFPIYANEEEGFEKLPQYTPTVYKIQTFPRKLEWISPYDPAPTRQWRDVILELNSTQLNIYHLNNYQKTFSASLPTLPLSKINELLSKDGATLSEFQSKFTSAQDLSNVVQYNKYKILDKAHLLKSYSLQHAKIGIAQDYKKWKYTLRLRCETEQFLIQFPTAQSMIEWNLALCLGRDNALDLARRSMPHYRTVPRSRYNRNNPNLPGRRHRRRHNSDPQTMSPSNFNNQANKPNLPHSNSVVNFFHRNRALSLNDELLSAHHTGIHNHDLHLRNKFSNFKNKLSVSHSRSRANSTSDLTTMNRRRSGSMLSHNSSRRDNTIQIIEEEDVHTEIIDIDPLSSSPNSFVQSIPSSGRSSSEQTLENVENRCKFMNNHEGIIPCTVDEGDDDEEDEQEGDYNDSHDDDDDDDETNNDMRAVSNEFSTIPVLTSSSSSSSSSFAEADEVSESDIKSKWEPTFDKLPSERKLIKDAIRCMATLTTSDRWCGKNIVRASDLSSAARCADLINSTKNNNKQKKKDSFWHSNSNSNCNEINCFGNCCDNFQMQLKFVREYVVTSSGLVPVSNDIN